jgi:hypothetical protein
MGHRAEEVTQNETLRALTLAHDPNTSHLRIFMRPEKMLGMHYLAHRWLAWTLALPFVILGAALEKQHGFASWIFRAAAWLLMNLS